MTEQGDEREKATITLPGKLKNRAKETGNMSIAIETALEEYFEERTIHFVNTNAQHVEGDGCKIYRNGVVATYGDLNTFGEYLRSISPGDVVLSYVSDGEVGYTGGARAVGLATAPWSGEAAPEGDRIYQDEEYHVPVKWLGVLSEDNVVSPDEVRSVVGRNPPRRTVETPSHDYQGGMELLAEVVLGRTILGEVL